jgi:hypothetical protein
VAAAAPPGTVCSGAADAADSSTWPPWPGGNPGGAMHFQAH